MPMNAHTCVLFFGGVIFTVASNFLFIGQIPVLVTQNPRYSISVCPKYDLSNISFKTIIFRSLKCLFQFLQVIKPITFRDYQKVIDVCSDE